MASLKRTFSGTVDLELRLSLSPVSSSSYYSPDVSFKKPCTAPGFAGLQSPSPLVLCRQPGLDLSLATLCEDNLSSRASEAQDLRPTQSEHRFVPLAGTSASPVSLCKTEPADPSFSGRRTPDWGNSAVPQLVPLTGDSESTPRRTRRKNPSHKYDCDGHVWRKYSHKMLQGNKCERIYYACAEKLTAGCTARKVVDRPKTQGPVNPADEKVTVDGVHNHPPGRVQITGFAL